MNRTQLSERRRLAVFLLLGLLAGFILGVAFMMGVVAVWIESVNIEQVTVSFNETKLTNELFRGMNASGYGVLKP